MANYSWSRISTFNTCARKYDLRYVAGYEKKPSVENEGRMFGTSIHAGFAAYLTALFQNKLATEALDLAVAAARKSIEEDTVPNKLFFDWSDNTEKPDLDYYLMIEDLFNRAPKFLRYYLPRTEIGSRYMPVSIAQVLPNMSEAHIPAVEFEFTLPIDDENTLTGWVDAVLFDTIGNELVMFDWKSRKAFPRDDMALIDGQLHLYASVLNTQGASIRRVCMAQMRTGLPKPAELSKKDNLPLTGRASYDTTWEAWVASLPQAVDAEYYRPEMMDKVKQHTPDFWRPVFGYVTDASVALTMDNTHMQIENIEMVLDNGTLSGVLSYQTCGFCEFAKLCANGFRYGGNVTEILQRDFQQRDSGLEIIMEDEA